MHTSRILPCLIFWFLWAERNNCRHNDARFLGKNVIWQVQMHLQKLSSWNLLGNECWRGCNPNALRIPRVVNRRIPPRPEQIKWIPPESPWLKLNIKCSFFPATSQASGGGVIRNSNGRLTKAFLLPMQARSSLDADLQTIAYGLSIARLQGNQIWVEMDATQTVALLQGKGAGPASTKHLVVRIRNMCRELDLRFSLIPREGNRPA